MRVYLSPSAVAAGLAHELARPLAVRRIALGSATAAALAAAGLAHERAASTGTEDLLAAVVHSGARPVQASTQERTR